MILKTILFFLVLYVLIRVVSSLFLPSANKKNSNVRFFYRTFSNLRDQQKRQQEKHRQETNPGERLNEIEEAEYEDVTGQEADSGDKKKKEK